MEPQKTAGPARPKRRGLFVADIAAFSRLTTELRADSAADMVRHGAVKQGFMQGVSQDPAFRAILNFWAHHTGLEGAVSELVEAADELVKDLGLGGRHELFFVGCSRR